MSQPEEPNEQQELPKEWTVMFYFASDNPLAPSAVQQLKAIKNAGYHQDANVLVQFDPHTLNTPAHIFDVNRINKIKAQGKSDVGFLGRDPIVRNLVCDKLWAEKKIRNGIAQAVKAEKKSLEYDPPIPEGMSQEQNPRDSLENFLTFCGENYPARHYMLFMIGHGLVVGNDMFLLDEHGSTNNYNSPQHSLLLTDLGKILKNFKTLIGKESQLELIGFHACSMSGAEVAFELRDTANYMLASQGPAFVGSWPYRQILVRLFDELRLNKASSITKGDLLDPCDFFSRLRTENSAYQTLRRELNGELNGELGELLKQLKDSSGVPRKLFSKVVRQLNGVVVKSDKSERLSLSTPYNRLVSVTTKQVMEETKQIIKEPEEYSFTQSELEKLTKQLRRQIISDAFPQQIRRIDVDDFLKKIFYYCLYNSFDFQLAGYSFDLCLCNLTQVGDIQKPLDDLSVELIRGLQSEDPLIRELILLAHWEAQSFFGENYTDLYDFCFCLDRKLSEFGVGTKKRGTTKPETNGSASGQTKPRTIRPASRATKEILKEISVACNCIMKELKRGKREADDGVIVRCEFAGPAFQYSHGLSIFFPWAEPVGSPLWDNHYDQFELIEQTSWGKFLKEYFAATQRKPRVKEGDKRDKPTDNPNLELELLTMMEEASAKVFNNDGQLNKSGAHDTVGPGGNKSGSHDPTGSDCDCGSIKNYPSVTRSKMPVSPNFFRKFRPEMMFPNDRE